MKTVKQKAQDYDKALEIAKSYYESPRTCFDINALTDMFSELRESEDENIIKKLIHLVKKSHEQGGYALHKWEADKMLDWLEKQTKKDGRYKYLEELLEADTIYQMAMNDAMVEEAKTKAREAISNMEIFELLGFEKQATEKDIDNVTQIFNVGEWVVNKFGDAWHIDSFDKKNYQVSDGKGNYNYFPIAKQDEMRHWSIADVKDGDILSNGKMIVIFKQFEEPSYRQHIIAYIGLDNYGNIQVTDDIWTLGIDKANLATKEQRDLLFQKMQESGYTFDFGNKELNKIEDEPENYKHQLMSEMTDLVKEYIKQTPSEWSEEDEKNLYHLKTLLENLTKDNKYEFKVISDNDRDKYTAWLNYLKERIQPHAKQEWTEEDEKRVNRISDFIWKNRKGDTDEIYQQEQDANWIKSLKGKYTWKPSYEQLEALW